MANYDTPPSKGAVRRFMIFLALVFLAQGLGQVSGVISQPLTYFLKEALGWQPDQVTRFFSLLIIPWIIKPVYGWVSDRWPVFGYRRKPYLIVCNVLVTLSCLWMTGLTHATMILAALFLNALGMAAASTITEAVIVENGNNWGMSGRFLNTQWFWFNLAAVGAALGGGWLAQNMAPGPAFHTAAAIACVAPLAVAIGCWFLLDEKPDMLLQLPQEPQSLGIFGNKTLWVVALFLFVWNIVPSFGTPLYYHMVDHLKFDQRFIGILGAVASVGSLVGAGAYTLLARKLSLKWMLYLAVVFGTLSQASYLLFSGHWSALIINFTSGIVGTVALVGTLTVAAHATPNHSAGFAYALLMSVNNLAGQLASNIGSWLFVHTFHSHLTPLIIVAAVGTFVCGAFIPMLKLGNSGGNAFRKETPVHPAATLERKRFSCELR